MEFSMCGLCLWCGTFLAHIREKLGFREIWESAVPGHRVPPAVRAAIRQGVLSLSESPEYFLHSCGNGGQDYSCPPSQ